MKNLAGPLILLLVIGLIIFALSQRQNIFAPDQNPEGEGAVVVVTSENFDQVVMKSDLPVVLDFGAPW
jgi:thioredoxin-like negative regulator of GroEL